MTSAPLSPWSALGRCPPCPRTAIWSPAGGQAPQTHTTPTPHHPGHQLFSIIASQWIKLINIQTRWLLHPIFCCVCECVRSSSLDIGFVHIISTCYTVVVCCIVSCSSIAVCSLSYWWRRQLLLRLKVFVR